jgi:ATP-dependent DNA helicase PIF1
VPFDGKVVILGGDLRQTLPVIQGGSRSEIVDSAIINSSLWSHVVVLHLTINMRLSTHDLSEKSKEEHADFS